MKIEIKNRLNDQIILCGEYESIKDCLEKNRGANLQDAYLRGANGIELPIITISGSRHTFYYHAGEITIGCNTLTVEDWLDTEKAKSLGKIDESYTEAELAEYRQYVELVAKLMKK